MGKLVGIMDFEVEALGPLWGMGVNLNLVGCRTLLCIPALLEGAL